MTYVISDIHGCYREYVSLLDKIGFSGSDELYVLGDAVDRGPEPMLVLKDMMLRPNVFPIIGNHEYMAMTVLKRLAVDITEENAGTYLREEDIRNLTSWIEAGEGMTLKKFTELDREERLDILDYLSEFSYFEELYVNGRRYVLVHADLHGFEESKPLSGYTLDQLIFYKTNCEKRYFSDPDTFLVTGHTPTVNMREDRLPLVLEKNGHIAVDCGCVFGGKLAAYCLDNGKTFYVDRVE